jgi:general secretion pathway protein D
MKFHKLLIILLIFFNLNTNLLARQKVALNIDNLEIMDFVKLTSKVIGKNILIDQHVKGKIQFQQNTPLYEDEILDILIYVLEAKGFTVVDNNGILRLVRLNSASSQNIPVFHNKNKHYPENIITEVFVVKKINVDYASSKIRHLMSKSGKLVTDKSSNSIIITDFGLNIATIKKVLKLIGTDNEKFIQSVKVENLNATAIYSDLKNVANNVFDSTIESEKIEIILNKDINSFMFIGKKSNVKFLIDHLKQIDIQGSATEKVVEIVYLKNGDSKEVLNILNTIIAKKKYKTPEDKPSASLYEDSNSIVMIGIKNDLNYLKGIIKQLDIDKQQVYVKARIIQLSELKSKEVGVKYGLFGGTSSSNSGLMTLATRLGGNALAITPSDIGLSIPSLNKGLALGATISLLNQNNALDIVSEPSILCINNKESSIYVGETRSIKTGTTTTDGGNVSDTYKREDIGLTLKVKPRISTGNKVSLDIVTKLEDVGETTTNDQPNTYKKDISTTAIVNNGESIILGGYIKSKNDYIEDKIPLLGDIPVVGNLFKNNRKVEDKLNLVIIITPYIVPKTKDLTFVRDQLAQLKLLEDKYLKDTLVNLKKTKLEQEKINLERIKESKKIDDELDEVRNSIQKNNTKYLSHENEIKKMFGI